VLDLIKAPRSAPKLHLALIQMDEEEENMPFRILLVEDNSGDIRMMREILLGANNSVQLLVASDGVEAMAFLKRQGTYLNAPRPDLILMDLNLPKMDGREALAHIKADASLRVIPVIVLTTSDAEVDVMKSYQLQANCYLSKPGELNEFETLVKSITDLWVTRVKLPRESQTASSPS
jgi:chemotaxis family two-component system response regulator Rcp1